MHQKRILNLALALPLLLLSWLVAAQSADEFMLPPP